MKEDTIVVKIEFYDHEPGREQSIYGVVKAIKIDRFETNKDSWITLSDSYRMLNVPKIDVLSISEFKDGEVIYCKGEENSKDLVGMSSS